MWYKHARLVSAVIITFRKWVRELLGVALYYDFSYVFCSIFSSIHELHELHGGGKVQVMRRACKLQWEMQILLST